MRVSKKLMIIAEFIPLILALFFYLNSFQFILFTHTVLGKFVLLILVLFYTYIDHIVGLFFCLLYIFYYQTDFSKIMNDMYLRDRNTFIEGYTDYESDSDSDEEEDSTAQKSDKARAAEFVSKHCLRGRLMNPGNGGQVNMEMMEHVFPQLGFSKVDGGGGGKCNPCDKTCKFSIIEHKLKMEETIIKPRESNSWIGEMLGIGKSSDIAPSGTPGVISEAFSTIKL